MSRPRAIFCSNDSVDFVVSILSSFADDNRNGDAAALADRLAGLSVNSFEFPSKGCKAAFADAIEFCAKNNICQEYIDVV